jgi:hypothetical protein
MYPKSQKKNKKIYKTLKGSSRVTRGRTFFSCETFLSSVKQKKAFVGKYEIFKFFNSFFDSFDTFGSFSTSTEPFFEVP